MLKNFRVRVEQARVQSGFSLFELLIGLGIGSLVVVGGGTAIAAMLTSSTSANARSERRIEINRALDFIAIEVSSASELIQNPEIPNELVNLINTSDPGINSSTITPVLQLNLPGSGENATGQIEAISSQPVTYFLADSADGSWRGPKVLYRWGPAFNDEGAYINPAATSDWQVLALVDRLEDFNTQISGNVAQLMPTGRIQQLLGRTESYPISRQANIRGSSIAQSAFNNIGGSFGTISSLFNITSGNVQINTDSRVDIRFLGGQITCGSDGPDVPTLSRATLRDENGVLIEDSGFIDPANGLSYDVTAQTTLRLDGWLRGDSSSGTCQELSIQYNTEENQGTQVLTLVDGDVVPEFRPLGNQRNISDFLEEYIDSDSGRVQLRPNEVIFLYELGTTDSSSEAYDLQDLVVLATIAPTQTSSTSTSSVTETDVSFGISDGNDGGSVANNRRQVVRDELGNIICTPAPDMACN